MSKYSFLKGLAKEAVPALEKKALPVIEKEMAALPYGRLSEKDLAAHMIPSSETFKNYPPELIEFLERGRKGLLERHEQSLRPKEDIITEARSLADRMADNFASEKDAQMLQYKAKKGNITDEEYLKQLADQQSNAKKDMINSMTKYKELLKHLDPDQVIQLEPAKYEPFIKEGSKRFKKIRDSLKGMENK